jgi:hypothetical protein
MDTDMLKIKANITHSMFDFTANKIDFEWIHVKLIMTKIELKVHFISSKINFGGKINSTLNEHYSNHHFIFKDKENHELSILRNIVDHH